MVLDAESVFRGAVMLAPMTKGSNLPYRRLCQELGASVTMGEMALARMLQKRRKGEFALIRRHPEERCFGVQLAGNTPDEMAWAAALAVERGADLVDVNLGCPIHEMTRRGLGSALLQKPARVQKIVAAMRAAIGAVPLSVKIRLAFEEGHYVHVKVAQAAVEGGADAVVVHGRTRDARYRRAADWDRIGEVVAAVPVPVVGNGDILYPADAEAGRQRSGCAGVMIARGALIKPWIFREMVQNRPEDPSAEERVAMMRRYVELAREHWGTDERATGRIRAFVLWHMDFWFRYIPPQTDGSVAGLQERATPPEARSPLEALLARPDAGAHGWLADRLLADEPIEEPFPEVSAESYGDLVAPIPEG